MVHLPGKGTGACRVPLMFYQPWKLCSNTVNKMEFLTITSTFLPYCHHMDMSMVGRWWTEWLWMHHCQSQNWSIPLDFVNTQQCMWMTHRPNVITHTREYRCVLPGLVRYIFIIYFTKPNLCPWHKILATPLWSKTKLEDPQVSSGYVSPWNVIFSLQCFDTVGWATGRTSGL